MRTVLLGLALLLCLLGHCHSTRNEATCSLEIIGNGKLGGLKSVKLNCNGSKPVDVGINTTIVTEQYSRLFTGVAVSPQGCQRSVSKGLRPMLSLHWIAESVLFSGATWGNLIVAPEDVRMHPLIYFCGEDDLIFNNLTVYNLWLQQAAPLTAWNWDRDVPYIFYDYLLREPVPFSVTIEQFMNWSSNWSPDDNDHDVPFSGRLLPLKGDLPIEESEFKLGLKHCQVDHARMSEEFAAIPGKLGYSLTLAAAVGFGGRVSASVTGVLQGNVVSSLIVATEQSRVQLKDAKLAMNMGFSGTGVLAVGASTLHVVNSLLYRNIAVTHGGAVAAGSGTTVVLVDSIVMNNIAGGGAGLFVCGNYTILPDLKNEAHASVKNITFAASQPASVDVTNSSFLGNCAVGGVRFGHTLGLTTDDGRGGGVLAVGSNLRLVDNTTLDFNFAAVGGGLSSEAGTLTINGCLLQDNAAVKFGGAVTVWKGLAQIVNSTAFTNNSAQMMGGAVALVSATVSVENSSVGGNSGGQCGGGLFVTTLLESSMNQAASSLNVSNSTISDNSARTGAGICSQPLESFYLGDDYKPDYIYEVSLKPLAKDETVEPVRGVSSIYMVVATYLNNTGGEGWDVYADNNTSTWFGHGVNIHRQNASVLWRRKCTAGELPTGDGSCLACGAFSYSLSAGGPCIPCNSSAYCPGGALVTPLPGFWHAAGGSETPLCPSCSLGDVIRCPNQLACNHTVSELVTHNRYNPNITLVASSWAEYGELLCNRSGYTGLLCASCKPGYGQTDAFMCDTCIQNGQGEVDRTKIWACMFGYGVAFLLLIWFTIRSDVQESHSQGADVNSQGMQVTDVIKALTMYAQYLAGVIAKLPVDFPDSVSATFNWLASAWSIAFGSHASLDCLLTPTHGVRTSAQAGYKGLITLLLPVLFLVVTVVLQGVWWLAWPLYTKAAVQAVKCVITHPFITRRGMASWFGDGVFLAQPRARQEVWFMHMQARLRRHPSLWEYLCMRWTVTVLVVYFFFFPSIARVAVGMFACQAVCGERYWVLDMAQSCPMDHPNSEHGRWAFGIGVPAIVFIVAMPLLIVAVLWAAAHRQLLQEEWFMQKFGFMYSDYEVHQEREAPLRALISRDVSTFASWCRHRMALVWDAVIHVQTVALMFISVYGMMIHEYYQVLILTVVFGFYLILVVWLRPFRVHANQRLQAASTAVLFGTSLCMLTFIEPDGLDAQQQQGYDKGKNAMGVVVLVVNALFVVIAVALLVASAVHLAKRTLRSEDAEQQGVDGRGDAGDTGNEGGEGAA